MIASDGKHVAASQTGVVICTTDRRWIAYFVMDAIHSKRCCTNTDLYESNEVVKGWQCSPWPYHTHYLTSEVRPSARLLATTEDLQNLPIRTPSFCDWLTRQRWDKRPHHDSNAAADSHWVVVQDHDILHTLTLSQSTTRALVCDSSPSLTPEFERNLLQAASYPIHLHSLARKLWHRCLLLCLVMALSRIRHSLCESCNGEQWDRGWDIGPPLQLSDWTKLVRGHRV